MVSCRNNWNSFYYLLIIACMKVDKKKVVKVRYKNWKGRIAVREIFPIKLWFGFTEWHPEEQWLLKVYDMDKEAVRDYAMKDIIEWMG